MSDRSITNTSTPTETSPRSATSMAPAAIAALVNSIVLASTATAQSAAPDTVSLDKLTVEDSQAKVTLPSPKFTAAPVDTPQTIAIIPSEVFNQQAAANLSDVLRNTPGITFTAGENGNVNTGDSFFMRGSDASNSIFIDGVRDSGNYSRDIYNTQQVEVAKGPAGDNGRGNPAGYINLTTKTPQAASFQNGTVSYGFDDTDADARTRATIDVNETLANSPVKGTAFRLNALWQDGGVAGREIAENNRWAVAPSLAIGLGTPTRVSLAYEHFQQNKLPEFGVPSPAVPDVLPTNWGTAIEPDNFYGLYSDYDDVKSDSVNLRVEHDIRSDLRLSNQTVYRFTDRQAIYTSLGYNITPPNPLPTTPVTSSRQSSFRTNEVIANVTNLSAEFSTGSVQHTLASGLELTTETAYTKKFTGLGTAAANSSINPDPNRALTGFSPVRNGATDAQIDTAALYVFDTAKFNDKWQITGGARIESYDTSVHDVTATVTDTSDDDVLLSGKLGLVFKPTPASSIYLAYGNSARPPLTSALSPANGNGSPGVTGAESPGAEPQRGEIYELGTKWDFYQGKLSTTLAIFNSTNKNVSVATNALTGEPAAYGDTEVNGVEIGITGKVTDAWLVFGGFSYLDTVNNNPVSATADGADLQWTPEFSGNLWTTYAFPSSFVIGGGVQYVDSVARQTTNTPAVNGARLPEYWVASLMASYEITKNITLRLNVENVTDELYARALNNAGARIYVGAPRTYTLSADLKF
ncbi:MAG: TonB-dependent siderophore receptor [Nibricoccus sp.]